MRPSKVTVLRGPAEQVRAATVARMYFLDGRSKSDIASELGINRFKVARIIGSARESGVVTISIVVPSGIDDALSEQVRKALDLRHVVAVNVGDDNDLHIRKVLARAATALVSELITEADVLGVGCGRTLTMMADTMESLARCPVIQLTGTLVGLKMDDSNVELVRQFSAHNGGPAFPIYAPQLLPDTETAATLRLQPEVAAAWRRFPSVTKAVVAVGSWSPQASQLYDALASDESELLAEQGAVAEICATLLNAAGSVVAPDFTDRCIAISGAQLKEIDEVIAVAGGLRKTAAVRSVIAGGYANSLVTDTVLARQLLATAPKPHF